MPKTPLFLFLSLFLLSAHWGGSQSTGVSGTDLFQEGKQLYRSGNYSEAVKVLRSAYLELEKTGDKEAQASTQYYLAESLMFSGQIQEANETYKKAFDLAKKYEAFETLKWTAEALAEMRSMYNKHLEAIPYFKVCIDAAQKSGDLNIRDNCRSSLGMDFLRIGQLDSAQYYIEKGLSAKLSRQDSTGLEMNYNHLGNFYDYIGDHDQALMYHLKALDVLEKTGLKSQAAIQYNNISEIFFHQKNYPRAEEYAIKAVALAREQKLTTWLAKALHNLGDIKAILSESNEALDYYVEALNFYRKNRTGGLDHVVLADIAKIYTNQGKYEIALSYLQEGLEAVLPKDNKNGQIRIYHDFAKVYLITEQAERALQSIEQALPIIQEYDQSRFYADHHQLMLKYFQQTGQVQKALAAFRQEQAYRQQSYDLKQSEKVHELEERYERAKKNKKITQLNAENELRDLKIKESRRNNLIISFCLLLALGLVILLYYFNRTRRLANEHLGEKNLLIAKSLDEKEILLREIHHRVKNNLQVISSLLRLQSKYIKDEKALDAIHEGRNRVKSMALIHQNLYKEDNLTGVRAPHYIQKLSESLFRSYNIDGQRVQLATAIDELNIDVDTIIPLGLIINELLTNALKHAYPEGQEGVVQITLKQKVDHLLLEVKDDGVGLHKDQSNVMAESGFGMKLIDALSEKLQAELVIQQENGTLVRLLIRKFKLL